MRCPRQPLFRCLCYLSCLGLLLLLAGCSTPQWKGTPYYHTEPSKDVQAAKDRVFWPPVVMYRSPTLEVAWPLFEASDEYRTLRPLVSAYGLNKPPDSRVYSLLWPLGVFNREQKENRFVPFFWGEDYCVGFPLYWHFNHPLGADGGTDTLFPLWWYTKDKEGHSLNIVWPFINFKDRPDGSGWRVWPLAGAYSGGANNSYYRFLAWPLAHQWSPGKGGGEGSTVIPLYLSWNTLDERSFYSLLYSRHRDSNSAWDLLLPLMYHSRGPGGSKTFTPLFFQGVSADRKDFWQLFLPLYYARNTVDERSFYSLLYSRHRDSNSAWDLLLPLMYHSRDPEGSKTFTPLFFQGVSADRKNTWQLLLPLYYARNTVDERSFYSLLYSRHRDSTSAWDLLLPLMYHSRDPEGSKTLTPLFFQGESADRKNAWQMFIPLYYSSRRPGSRSLFTLLGGMSQDEAGMGWVAIPLLAGGIREKDGTSVFMSLPWSSGSYPDGSRWSLIPPLMFKSENGANRRLITPLYAAGTSDGGTRSWQAFIPLWYQSEGGGEKMVATLAGGWQTDAEGRRWIIWPLLSGGHKGADGRDFWLLAPMFHAHSDQYGVSHHLLPLYWWDAKDKRLISPIVSSWGNPGEGTKTTLVPPALTLYKSEPKRTDLWAVAGLAHMSRGEEAGSSHILPLYYRNPRSGTFLSLPWSRWAGGEGLTNTLIAPALTLYTSEPKRTDLWAVAGLAHMSRGEEAGSSHILPLYYRNPRSGTFLSLPWSRWAGGEGLTNTLIAPALTLYKSEPKRTDLWAVAGLAHMSRGEEAGSSHILPLYYRNPRTGTFLSLPWSRWAKGESLTNTLVAPALSWISSREGRSDLWALGPISHFSWGENATSSHIFPLYLRDQKQDLFLSIPYTHWKDGETERHLYPPLLSMYSKTGGEKRLDALLGLFSERWGEGRRDGYFLPLYYYEAGHSFYTPIFGSHEDPESGFYYPLTPLVGVRTGSHSGGWVFPLWSRNHDKKTHSTTGTILWGSFEKNSERTQSSVFPFYSYKNLKKDPALSLADSIGGLTGRKFWSLPAIWFRDTVSVNPVLDTNGHPTGKMETSSARDNGCFPFWTYSHLVSRQGGDETFGSLFMFLYNYETKVKPVPQPGVAPEKSVHKRVLWWLWNYQRDNDLVTVDIFPGMTYDSGADGFRKWSFLWRVFRYEKGPEGKKLDLFFVPLQRSSPSAPRKS